MDAVEKLLEKVEKRGEKKPLATGETPDVKDVKLPKQSKESNESNESNKSNKLHKPNETIEIHKAKSSNQSYSSRKSMKFFDSIEPTDSKEAEKTSQSMHSLQSLQSLLSFKQERSYLFPDVADYRFVDYASVYFQRKKTFFRNASVEPLCCFSAKPLLHPLHPVNRMHLADILGFEHSILTIQGVLPDAKSHRHSAVYGLLSNADLQKLDSIIRGLIRFPDLTDEIFAFFIRQTNECTDARAESKAFEALFVLSQFCRPSDQLLPYLVAHLYKRCHSDDEVALRKLKLLKSKAALKKNKVNNLFAPMFLVVSTMFIMPIFIYAYEAIFGEISMLALVTLMGLIVLILLTASSITNGSNSKYAKLTRQGIEMAAYLDGLREYISLAEVERLQVLQSVQGADTSPAGVVKLYERLLPYAALFGYETSWLKTLSRYYEDLHTAPTWCASTTATHGLVFFTMSDFSSLNRASNTGIASGFGSSGGGSWGSGGSSSGFSGGGGGGCPEEGRGDGERRRGHLLQAL